MSLSLCICFNWRPKSPEAAEPAIPPVPQGRVQRPDFDDELSLAARGPRFEFKGRSDDLIKLEESAIWEGAKTVCSIYVNITYQFTLRR